MRRRAAIHLGLFLVFTAGFVCAGSRRTFQLVGSIRQSDGKPFRGVMPVVFLQNAVTPFAIHTHVDTGGEFKFKNLLPGTYSLIITIPRIGELNKTIEIGQSFADSKGRVIFKATMEPRPQTLGKIERFWGTLWRECLGTAVFLDLDDARRRIGHFIDHYNFQRPHQGIDGLVDHTIESILELGNILQNLN